MSSDKSKASNAAKSAAGRETNREAFLTHLLQEAIETVHCDGGAIYLPSEDGLRFCRLNIRSLNIRKGGILSVLRLPPVPLEPAYVCSRALLEDRMVNVPDLHVEDGEQIERYHSLIGYVPHSTLAVPLKDDAGQLVAVIQLFDALDEDGNIVPFLADAESALRTLTERSTDSLSQSPKKKHAKLVYWLLALLIVGVLGVFFNVDVFDKGANVPTVDIYDALQYYSKGDRSYIINNTGLEVMVFENDRYQYSIAGGLSEGGFYQAVDVQVDDMGNLYVLDKVFDDNGTDINGERIFRYTPDGAFDGLIYELPHEDGSGVLQLYNMTILGDTIRLICTDPESTFSDMTIDIVSGEVLDQQVYPCENVYENAWDFAFDDAGNIILSSKTGAIEQFNGLTGEHAILYQADEAVGEYFSIPTTIAYASDGTIYFNDVGTRTINKLHPDGTIEIAVDIAEPIVDVPEAFNEKPIYSGLFVGEDLQVATFYAHSYFLETGAGEGEQIYEYNLFVKNADGTHAMNGSVFEKESSLYIRGTIVFVLSRVVILLAAILLVMACLAILRANISGTVRTQLVIIFTAVIAAAISLYVIVGDTNERYYDEIMNHIENVTMLMTQSIEADDLIALNTPADYMSPAYQNVSKTVSSVLDSDVNDERGIYCVIYKAQKDIVSVIYGNDALYGTGWPMPGGFEGSAEQMIYETGEYISFASHSSADGHYMFVLAPIFDENEEVIGLMEVGTNLYTVSEGTRQQVIETILLVLTAVLVGVLLVSELVIIRANSKRKPRPLNRKAPLDSSLIRPVVFLFYFASNMPTAFLPIYARDLWTDSFPVPVEVATALPVSTEMLITAIISLAFGFAVSRMGVKLMCILGALLFGLGNVVCAFAPSLMVLVGGSALTGMGDGLLILAINAYIAGYEDERQMNDGFAHSNAALLSGINCGTVIGSVIAEHFGYSMTYIAAIGVTAVLGLCCFICIRNHAHTAAAAQNTKKPNALRFLFHPRVLKYFLLISVPYLICGAFLNYFFPIFGEENGLTPTQISMAFLIVGVISIYFGPGLTKLVSEQLEPKKSMLLATALYAAALLIFIVRPTISTCYLSVAIFAFADSFGFTSKAVYYSTLPETIEIGEGPAMGISSGFDNAASTAGPLIFGSALMLGQTVGISLIAGGFILLAVLFVLTSFRAPKKD